MSTEYENQGFPEQLDFPANSAFVITPNDSEDLEHNTRGIYIGTAGNLKVDMLSDGVAITFHNLIAGVVYPYRVSHVYSGGTTADNLIGLY